MEREGERKKREEREGGKKCGRSLELKEEEESKERKAKDER